MMDLLSEPAHVLSIAISAAFFFVFIVVLVRVIGKRSTSQLNNFDWIINITVGSLAASGILLRDVHLLDAALAIAVLAGLQMLTTWSVLRSDLASKIVKAQPVLLTTRANSFVMPWRKSAYPKKKSAALCGRTGCMMWPMPTGSYWKPMASWR